ncbi:MAG: hypothetical protein WCP08_11740 [Prolixibacteraceae bacterium]
MKTIQIDAAKYLEGYKVEIVFSDKTKKIVDFGNFILNHPHPVHDKYKDLQKFKSFKIESGNIVWGDNWDLIFPISQIYRGKIKA